ncbi:hypothetical protein RHMOL_Rhmol12G0021800 [Rhododendron molle]|uniref:Uncharacterized protein n=1 Tax=Rhododendron molle TaxID=49168 RepID=A0ACC0LF49_RHOML|nr:hypothetical protein RHMOL_Rhmol12G0021800 [Rhododendron molle]
MEIWEGVMCVVLTVVISVIQAIRPAIVDFVINRSVSRGLGRLRQGRAVVDLQKIEELKTQIKGLEAENKVLRENNGAMEKQLVQSPVPLSGQYQGSFGGQILSLTFEGKLGIIKSNIGEGGIPLGPWGGNGGGYWAYKLDVAPIMQITLGYGSVIDSILIRNKSYDGNVIGYGPYGTVFGSTVSIPIEGAVLAGFHGRAGLYLDAFGVLVAPKVPNSLHKVGLSKSKEKFGGEMGVNVKDMEKDSSNNEPKDIVNGGNHGAEDVNVNGAKDVVEM